MDRELTSVIEDFDRVVNVEALRLAKKNGKHPLSQPGSNLFSINLCRARNFDWTTQTCRD
jgi:hypothetical protein